MDDIDNVRTIVVEQRRFLNPNDFKNTNYLNLSQGQQLIAQPYDLNDAVVSRILNGRDPNIKRDQVV